MSNFGELNVEGLMLINDLIQTNSLKRTANNLHMSTSAAYRILVKLRKIFDDELFIRNGLRMMPTPMCISIRDKVSKGLTALDDLNKRPGEFDPSTLHRTFKVAMHEAMFAVHFLPLCQKLLEIAPNVTLDIQDVGTLTLEKMKAAKIDYAIIPMDIFVSKEIISLPLFETSWTMLVRKNHPVLKKAKNGCISFKEISKLKEVRLSVDNIFETPYTLPEGLDYQIDKGEFVRQKTAVWLPYVCAALDIVKNTDFTYLIYSRHADKICASSDDFQRIEMDPRLGKIQMALKWHENLNSDVVGQWFRSVLISVFKELPPSTPSAFKSLHFSE